ncbi:MAG TPA: arginine--tRNA ligase, partial [bacterium]|nr:arginine--tRNA ligase [bacterium]
MKTVFEIIKNEFCCAISQVAPLLLEVDPMIRLTTEGKFGDYQSNVAMGLAKTLRRAPREVAQEIVQNLQLAQVCERVEIAGPGFINLFLSRDYLAGHLTRLSQEARLGAEQAAEPVHHIIDYSSPNLAKEMHVGHLRSTIIGEVLARVIEFAGHTVDRVNHVG